MIGTPINGAGLKAGSTITYSLQVKNSSGAAVTTTAEQSSVVTDGNIVPDNTRISTTLACTLPPGNYSAQLLIKDIPQDQCGANIPSFLEPASRTLPVRNFSLTKTGAEQTVTVDTMVLDTTNTKLQCFTATLNKKNKPQTAPGMNAQSGLMEAPVNLLPAST